MTNYLKLPTWADSSHVHAVVETPRGSRAKLEFDPKLGAFTLAKPLLAGLTYSYDICFGTSPIQAAKSRPLVKASPAPIAATIALDMIGPIPGTLINRSHPDAQQSRSRWISLRYGSSSRRQSPQIEVEAGANIL